MTIEPWTCDRCGEENPYVNTNTVTDWVEKECSRGHVFHLCPDCHSIYLMEEVSSEDELGCPICDREEQDEK